VAFAGVRSAAVPGRLDLTIHVLLRFAHISSIFGLLVVFLRVTSVELVFVFSGSK
jgi:hypothetical protein